MAEFREGQREIHGDGSFTDAALSAGNGHEILYAGDWRAFRHRHGRWGHC
jgi:hypothetical protein